MKKFPTIAIDTERVLLEKFFMGATGRVPRRVLQELTGLHSDQVLRQSALWAELSPITDELILWMRTYMLKGIKDEKETMSVTYPATWFDHLKDAWLKSGVSWKTWLGRRFAPPKYTTEAREVKTIRVCPHYDSYFSESQQHIQYLLWRTPNPINDGYRLE